MAGFCPEIGADLTTTRCAPPGRRRSFLARDLLDKLRRRPVGAGPDEPPF